MTTRPENKIETFFEEPGSLLRPGIVGRTVRLLLGLVLIWSLYVLLAFGRDILVDRTPPNINWWFYMALAFWLTPAVVSIGFTKNWKRKPQIAILTLAAVAVVIDLAFHGTWWAPPLGLFVWLWLIYFSAHLGLSFALAALLATPGCEMRAIPHLWTRLTGRETKEHYCPGFLDGLDRWEAGKAPRSAE